MNKDLVSVAQPPKKEEKEDISQVLLKELQELMYDVQEEIG